jgi:two-component system, OmpR family, sensor histidine kinase VicK
MTNLPILSSLETTEIIEGIQNIFNRALAAFSSIKEQLDGCYDFSDPVPLITTEGRWKGIIELAERGVKLRYLTEITKYNIDYCKEMIGVRIELRHLEGVKGNFGIADRTGYPATLVQGEGRPPTHAIVSNLKSFVEQQQYFFDTLWQKAIPAQENQRD